MASGLIVLALAAAYYVTYIVANLWSAGEPLFRFILSISYAISGQGFHWPGLTVGALLGVLGAVLFAWPRLQVPDLSGKGVRALVLLGSAILLAAVVFGTFQGFIMELLYGRFLDYNISRGLYVYTYQSMALIGFTFILAGMVWASWKARRWRMPLVPVAVDRDAADEETSPH